MTTRVNSKEIAKKESLRYNEVLLSNTFASSMSPGVENGEVALENLAVSNILDHPYQSGLFPGAATLWLQSFSPPTTLAS